MISLLVAAPAFVDMWRLPTHRVGSTWRSSAPVLSEPPLDGDGPFDIDAAMGAMDKAVSNEDYAEAARLKKLIDKQVALDRAQLTRQLSVEATSTSAEEVEDESPNVSRATALAPGQILVASPERFCSANPFARPIMDMGRFGIQGAVKVPGLPPDRVAERLPVLILLEHDEGGSRALLMEQRTGALMGDVSMDDYGPCAVSPLWIGGTAKPNSLYMLHDVPQADGANEVSSGLYLGGWEKLKPKVADSSVSEARLKFFVGATEWGAGQLEKELSAGAWIALDVPANLVVKDRVSDWRPGQPKPVWTEMMNYLPSDDADVAKLMKVIYGE